MGPNTTSILRVEMSFVTMRIENPSQGETNIVLEIMRHFDNGADVLFSRSHTGEAKIKVKHGPFKLRTTRYTVNDRVAVAVKDAMRARIKVF
jgi:hypothetical protein